MNKQRENHKENMQNLERQKNISSLLLLEIIKNPQYMKKPNKILKRARMVMDFPERGWFTRK